MKRTFLIFGCGYTCKFLAIKLIQAGWHVVGTIRSSKNSYQLNKLGIEPVYWDDVKKIKAILADGCSIINSIPPNNNGDIVFNRYYDYLISQKEKIDWFGFLSSTGVYGNKSGNWVTEDSHTKPITENGKLRLKAEENWLKLSRGTNIPVFIFRIAGIYGPGRSVFDRIESGTVEKVVKKDQYFNRIHVEDIVGAVGLALESPLLQGVYNLSDDMPSSGDVVIDEATRILGLPKIKETLFENATLSEMAKSFYEDSKKVSNRKLRQILGYSLKYPTYKSGLVSIFDSTKD